MKKKLLKISLILLPTVSFAGLNRIQSIRYDRSQVQRIYLAPGLGSKITFPCPVQEAFSGRNEDLKAIISPNDKRLIYLNLKLNNSLPTNLLVQCEQSGQYFVFDVIPSKTKHQDIVEISSSFGRPNDNLPKAQSSYTPETAQKFVLMKPILVSKGSSK